ncbi:MAG: HYR domain-containing protein [Gemmatimonadaceae bacterium]|nr:HYR domain-containing protein [Gemmatimonadaceae bacterium]
MKPFARHAPPLRGRTLAGALALLVAISACSDRTAVGPDRHASPRSPSASLNDGTTPADDEYQLTEPASLGSPFLGPAAFGPRLQQLPGGAITGQPALVSSGLPSAAGCTSFTDDVAGKIALIRRGTCAFTVKVKNAQDAGAIAVIIYDNVTEVLRGMAGTDETITIPALFASAALGQQLISTNPAAVTLSAVAGEFPTLNLPADLTVTATTATATGVAVRISIGATDNSGSASVSCSLLDDTGKQNTVRSSTLTDGTFVLQDVIPFGSWTVRCTASDAAQNTTSGSFALVSRPMDTTPPTVMVPPDLTVEATGPAGAAASFAVTATDDRDGPIAPTCTAPSGSTFPLGVTTVSCTATDAAGNSASASFMVNVVDTQAPTISAPTPITVDATSPAGAVVTVPAPNATDVVGVALATCGSGAPSTFPIGTTNVTCTASDAAGNVSTATTTVTVRGAPEQIANLIQATTGLALSPTQTAQLVSALQTALDDPRNLPRACRALDGYIALVRLASRGTQPAISMDQAAKLITDATRIEAVLGCR